MRYEKIKNLAITLNRFPTHTEIMIKLGLKSKSPVHAIIKQLKEAGLLNMKVYFDDQAA